VTWLISKALMEDYENSRCSREQEEEFLEERCLDGGQSVPSKSNPTPQAYLSPDRMTKFSRLSRYGMIFAPLTDGRGEGLLTWYREVFLARTYPQQEKEQELPVQDPDSGKKWQELLAKYDPNTCSWKTAQCLLEEGLEQSLEIWPKWGSMQNGACYQQPMLARPTVESVFGFLVPTPVSSDGSSGAVIGKNDRFYTTSTGLPRKVNQNGKDGSVGLGRLVKMWPTPAACMAKGSSPNSLIRKDGRSRKNDRLDHAVMASNGGSLNPTWAEWLMGWPLEWTDLKPLETDRCLCAQPLHGNCSRKDFDCWKRHFMKQLEMY